MEDFSFPFIYACFLYFFRFGLLNVNFYAVYAMEILSFSFSYDG